MQDAPSPQAALDVDVDPAPSTSVTLEDIIERNAHTSGQDLDVIGDAVARHTAEFGDDLASPVRGNYLAAMGGDSVFESVRANQDRISDMIGSRDLLTDAAKANLDALNIVGAVNKDLIADFQKSSWFTKQQDTVNDAVASLRGNYLGAVGGDSVLESVRASQDRISEMIGGRDLLTDAARANLDALNIGGAVDKDLIGDFHKSWFTEQQDSVNDALASLREAGNFGGIDTGDSGTFAPPEPIALPSYEIPDLGTITSNADIVAAIEVQHDTQLALIEEIRLGRQFDAERWEQHKSERAADEKSGRNRFYIECALIMISMVLGTYVAVRYTGST